MKSKGELAFPCATPAHTTCAISEYNMLPADSLYKHHYGKRLMYGDANKYGEMKVNLGFESTTTRYCAYSAADVPAGCSETGNKGTSDWQKGIDNWNVYKQYFVSCNKTCTENGCNWGSAMEVKNKYLGILATPNSANDMTMNSFIVTMMALFLSLV